MAQLKNKLEAIIFIIYLHAFWLQISCLSVRLHDYSTLWSEQKMLNP
jgi:hypothetical protein